MPPSSSLELLRRLSRLAPKQQLDALIDQTDAKRAVRLVPAEQLYTAITDVGLADATEIVQLASPEQFRAFVDLGAWKRDRVDPHQLLTWLRAARGEEPEDFLAKLGKLDLELLEYLLRAFTVIHDKEEDPDANPQGVTMETPEGKYLVEFRAEGVELFALRQLLSDLIAQDPFQAGRLIEAIRWELGSELEETAYQFRAARLEDLGFPRLEQALTLFTYVDPAPFTPAASAGGAALATERGRVDYLDAALGGLESGEQDALGEELRYLVNSTLVAEAAEPGEAAAIRRVAEMARDYLNLGLELLTGAQPERAAEVVREHPLKRVFQLGFSLTLKLKFKADRLTREPLARLGDTYLTLSEEAAGLVALRRKRPLRALKVEGAEPVPFRTRRELEESAALVERAGRQLKIFGALLGGTQASAEQALAAFRGQVILAQPDAIFTAVVANAVLEGAVRVAPVPAARLTELWERLFDAGPSLRASAVEKATASLAPLAPDAGDELRRMVDVVLRRLLAELGPAHLAGGGVDPALVATLLPVQG